MLTFAIKSAIYLSIMFIPYMLMLKNESFFRFNHVLLLCIMVLSLVLPLCDFHILAFSNNPLQQGFIQVGLPVAILDDQETTILHSANQGMSWVTIVAYLYITGIIGTLLYKMFQMTQLYRAINKGVLWKEKKDGITIYCHANDIMPFSWFNAVVISEKDYNETGAEILSHEMGHVRCHHSWDILLANIVEIVQWFNPLSWILASSLRDVHEYEADDAVLTSGVNIKQYQMLLIRKAIGANSYAFANGFNHSLLKKRITKMLQSESNPWRRTKALYIIPVAVIALSAFATPELNNRVDAIADKAPSAIVGKGTVKSETTPVILKEDKTDLAEMGTIAAADSAKKSKEDVKSADEAYDEVDEMPQFPGGTQALMQYLAKCIQYPKIAHHSQVAGRVNVQFIVEKDGSISNVKTISFKRKEVKPTTEDKATSIDKIKVIDDAKGATAEYVEAAEIALKFEAEDVVKSMPNWTPGKQKGEPVRVKFVIPIQFSLD